MILVFGYILPHKPELKIKEYELFNAFYCGICKSIGRRFGTIPRITIKYDSVFLAMLLYSITGSTLKINMERCIVHPVRPRHVVLWNDIIDYAADVNLILSYFSLKDKSVDEGLAHARMGMILLKPVYKKLKRQYGEKCDIIEKRLTELAVLEKEGCASMDAAAEPFAMIMEEVVAHKPFCQEEKTESILRWLGYNLGKWIYLLDAFDDMEADMKKKNYNPLLELARDAKKEITNAAGLKDRIKDRVEFNLVYSLDQVGKAYELLGAKNVKGILENIIYMGMLKTTERILGTGSCNQVESIRGFRRKRRGQRGRNKESI